MCCQLKYPMILKLIKALPLLKPIVGGFQTTHRLLFRVNLLFKYSMSHDKVSAFYPLLPAHSFTDHFGTFTSLLLQIPMLFFDSCNPSLIL